MLSFSTHASSWPQGERAFLHKIQFKGKRRMLHGSSVIRDLSARKQTRGSFSLQNQRQTASPQVYLSVSAVMPHLTEPLPECWLVEVYVETLAGCRIYFLELK